MANLKGLSLKDQLVGFPVWQIFVVSFARLAEPITFTSLFPYVYFMVRDFHIAKTEADISKYVGYLSSSFAVFEFLFSLQFGIYLDKYGRKTMLIVGLLGMAICVLSFGFSRNYWQAMISRSLLGAFNGSCLVIRTVVGEIAVKKRHQAILFSTLPLGWCIGSVVGPLIPSISSSIYPPPPMKPYDPKETLVFQMASTVMDTTSLEKLVTKYPYCLSNIIVAIFLIISSILLFLFMEETQMDMKSRRDIGLDIGDFIKRCCHLHTTPRPWKSFQPELFISDNDSNPLLIDEETASDTNYGAIQPTTSKDSSSIASTGSSHSSIQGVGPMSRRVSVSMVDHYSSRKNSIGEETPTYTNMQSLLLPRTFHTLLSSFLMSAHCLIFDEFLPVLLSSDIVREDPDDVTSPLVSKFPFKLVGGLGYNTSQIGNALAFTGSVGILVVLFVFPYLDGRYKSINVYRMSLMFFPVSYFLLPYLIFTVPPNRFTDSFKFTTFSVYSLFMLKTFGQSNAFPEIMLLLHRASPPKNRSFINGVLMSTTALARFLGLLVWGYIMSWANSHDIAWFPWWILGLMALYASVQVFFIDIPEDDGDDEDDDLE